MTLAMLQTIELPFADSVLPRIEAMLAEPANANRLGRFMAAHPEVSRSDYRSDVDYFLCAALPESLDMVCEYYAEAEGSAQLQEWFAASELAEIDTLLCATFISADWKAVE